MWSRSARRSCTTTLTSGCLREVPRARGRLGDGRPLLRSSSSAAGGPRRRWKRWALVAVVGAAAAGACVDLFVAQTPLVGGTGEGGLQDTYYARNRTEPLRRRPRLGSAAASLADEEWKAEDEADVCVVGAGYAGLVTALELAERGLRVVVLERERVGWGASGLNGGFMVGGFQVGGLELAELVGAERAAAMFDLTTAAQRRLIDRIRRYAIDCDLRHTGLATVSYQPGAQREAEAETRAHNARFGTRLEVWPAERVRELYPSDLHHHAVYDPSVHTVNPLNLVLGLARAAEENGVVIYEGSAAAAVERLGPESDGAAPAAAEEDFDYRARKYRVRTANGGEVKAGAVVLAGAAHVGAGLDAKVARAVAPVFTYIIVTEPLPGLREVIAADHAVCDDRFALNYYRPLPDGRLLWGGFAQTYPISGDKLKEAMVQDLLRVYPSLAHIPDPQSSTGVRPIRAETAWGGTLAYGISLMPMIGRRKDNGVWYATGFGGHGLVPTSMAGELLASAIASEGKDERWKMFQEEFPLRHAMWPYSRLAAQLMYWWYGMRDWWGQHAASLKRRPDA